MDVEPGRDERPGSRKADAHEISGAELSAAKRERARASEKS